jgi:CHAT domain-containing protein/Flp pilus assembly protein TadD
MPSRGASRLALAVLAVLLCGAAGTPPVSGPPLKEGLFLEREVKGGEVHVYPVELQAGQFLRVVVQEEGVDLQVQFADPGGVPRTGVDGFLGGEASEDLAARAAGEGRYELQVSVPKTAKTGRYHLRVEALGEPTAQDRLRTEAVQTTWDAFHVTAVEDQIRALEKAFALWQQLGNDQKSAEVLYALGIRRFELLAYESAVSDFQRFEALWTGRSGRAGKALRASALTYLARSLKNVERREEARATHKQALALARDVEDIDLQAMNLDNLGMLETEAGELRKGVDLQLQALDLARQAKSPQSESIILNNLAYAYEQLAETQKALQFYQQALKLAHDGSDRQTELIYLNNLGDTYRILGDWEKAYDYYQRSLKLSRSTGYRRIEGAILINLGGALRHLGQLAAARMAFEEALAVGRRSQSRETQTFALANLSLLLLQLKEPSEAADRAREAVALKGSLEEQTFSHYVLGSALQDLGNIASARTELENALALARRRGVPVSEAEICLALARLQRKSGDLPAALRHVQTAIELTESRRDRVVSPELRTSFLASKQDYYEFQVDTLMDLHAAQPAGNFAAEALQISEKARARGLLEILSESGADIHLGADPALIAREKEAREELNARDWYRRELLAGENPDRKKLAEAEQRLEEALDEYQKVQVALREGSPRYAALTQPQPLDVGEIQRQVLDGKALLLEYALGSKRSHVWAVGPDFLESFELPERERIEKTARRYYELLTVRNNRLKGEALPAWKKRIVASDAEAETVARDLSLLILQPVEKLLGDRPLLIVADGALQYIPFAALPIPSTGEPLATRHDAVNLPSASALAVLRRELRDRVRAPRTLAVFAAPVFQKDDERLRQALKIDRMLLTRKTSAQRGDGLDISTLRQLPFSQTEADTISALLPPGEVFKAVGFAASRATVEAGGLDGYRNVHFATHGVIDSRHPELSGLVLSLYNEKGERQDGFLRLNDIYNLRLDADLVVLSACRTALGKEIRGEGLIGLTRGFMYAGASRVLASLWSVEDRATAELMGSFYRGMLREGLSPAAALRKAQLEMAKDPHRKSPYYWAGFSLQGEWR